MWLVASSKNLKTVQPQAQALARKKYWFQIRLSPPPQVVRRLVVISGLNCGPVSFPHRAPR